jgi:hypothetical protein
MAKKKEQGFDRLSPNGVVFREGERFGSREAAKARSGGGVIFKLHPFQKPRKSQEVDTESLYAPTPHHRENSAQPTRHSDIYKMANEGRKG